MIEAMQNLKAAFEKLVELTENADEDTLILFGDCFPFKNSIDDTAYDVGMWVDDFVDAMNN